LTKQPVGMCFNGFSDFVLFQPIFDVASALDKFHWTVYWITLPTSCSLGGVFWLPILDGRG